MGIFSGDGQPYGSWEIVPTELFWAGFTASSEDAIRPLLRPQEIPVDNLLHRAGSTEKSRGNHGSA